MSSDSDDEPAVSHGANTSRRTGNQRILESSSEEEENEGKENKEEKPNFDSEEEEETGKKKTKSELTSSANKRKIRRLTKIWGIVKICVPNLYVFSFPGPDL
jgi:hypothetical protein